MLLAITDSSDKRWWEITYQLLEGIGELSSVEYDGRVRVDESSKCRDYFVQCSIALNSFGCR